MSISVPMMDDWGEALRLFDEGRRDWLAVLVQFMVEHPGDFTNWIEAPPLELGSAIASIILGSRLPDRRGIRKDRVSDFAKRDAVEQLRDWRERKAAMKATNPLPEGWTLERIDRLFDEALNALADRHGVKPETIEAWARPSRG